ncbi:MAG: IclR family transcriptional regulator [Lautropia sp.]
MNSSSSAQRNRPRRGTQSLERSIRIIKAIAEHGQFGWQLSDVARHCGLDKSTVFRILSCLVEQRVVRRNTRNERYMPGPLLFELSLSLPAYAAFSAAAEERLWKLAKRTGLMANLYYRSGDEAICAVVTGSGATRNYIKLASRRPMLGTAAGIAILLAMSKSEARDVVKRNIEALSVHRKEDIPKLKAMYLACQRQGFAIHESHVVPGINGIAVAVLDASSAPIASVVISATREELPRSQFRHVHELLIAEAQALSSVAAKLFADEAAVKE